MSSPEPDPSASDSTLSIERLEANHTFPCRYIFKAIGRNDDAFIEAVLQVARYELDLLENPKSELQRSSAGRHVSVTLSLDVGSATQVIAIYQKLQEVDGLKMLL